MLKGHTKGHTPICVIWTCTMELCKSTASMFPVFSLKTLGKYPFPFDCYSEENASIKNKVCGRVGAISKPYVSTPKSLTFVLKSTMNTKKWYLKVNNHPLIGFLVL